MADWNTQEEATQKMIVLGDGDGIAVEQIDAATIKRVASEKGYKVFTVSKDAEHNVTVSPNEDLSSLSRVYLTPKEKVM